MKRRQLLKAISAGLAVTHLPLINAAPTAGAKSPKFIWILLRGGMDSLHAIVPTADPHLVKMRGALVEPIMDQLQPLEHGFGLHPALKNLGAWYKEKSFAPVIATANGYRTRSHFKSQDYLESGLPNFDHDSGWLGRAIATTNKQGLAIARSVPISLRGQRRPQTWYPSMLPDADDDLYERLMRLYEHTPNLQQRLDNALATRELANQNVKNKSQTKFAQLTQYCAKLLRAEGGPDGAMLQLNGWDTHNNLSIRLNNKFKELDQGLGILRQQLGPVWDNTVIAIASEFGRTVAMNGTKGSDHGTASALLLTGGAIKGGKVLGQWPGLAKGDQYEGRDLRPTSDVRQWIGTALSQHWQLSEAQFKTIFPDLSPSNIQLA